MGCNRKVKLFVLSSFGGGSAVRTQLHKTQHGGKTDLQYQKRKLSDFGRIVSLSNTENCTKICQGTAENHRCIVLEHGGARLTTLPSGSVSHPAPAYFCLHSLSVCSKPAVTNKCVSKKQTRHTCVGSSNWVQTVAALFQGMATIEVVYKSRDCQGAINTRTVCSPLCQLTTRDTQIPLYHAAVDLAFVTDDNAKMLKNATFCL